MNFKPSDNYEHLKIQANALASIVNSREKTEAYYRELCQPEAGKKIANLKALLESEREMNAILTYENQRMEAELELLKLNPSRTKETP